MACRMVAGLPFEGQVEKQPAQKSKVIQETLVFQTLREWGEFCKGHGIQLCQMLPRVQLK